MSAVTASPSLVILDVDGEKRYRLESDKVGTVEKRLFSVFYDILRFYYILVVDSSYI